MFLIQYCITSLSKLLIGFNPYSNWTMFLIDVQATYAGTDIKFQSLFYLDNVSYFSLQNTLIKNDCFNPYFIWTMFLIKSIVKTNPLQKRFNPYFNWTMFLIAFFHLFPFIYLFYDRKYVAVFP